MGADRRPGLPRRSVRIVAYACSVADDTALTVSDEHTDVAFLHPAGLGSAELPDVYRRLIAAQPPVTG